MFFLLGRLKVAEVIFTPDDTILFAQPNSFSTTVGANMIEIWPVGLNLTARRTVFFILFLSFFLLLNTHGMMSLNEEENSTQWYISRRTEWVGPGKLSPPRVSASQLHMCTKGNKMGSGRAGSRRV